MPITIVSDAQMVDVFKRYILGEPLSKIGKELGVSRQTLSERILSDKFKPIRDQFITSLVEKATDDVIREIQKRIDM